jgi:hypothetical protein
MASDAPGRFRDTNSRMTMVSMTCGLAGVDVSAVCALENDNYIYGRLWPSVQQRQRGSDWTDLFAQGLPRINDRVVIAAVDLVGETV